MANSVPHPDLGPDSTELGHTMAEHLLRYARGLLKAGDREGAEEVFREAAHIQVQALQHVLNIAKPESTAISDPMPA